MYTHHHSSVKVGLRPNKENRKEKARVRVCSMEAKARGAIGRGSRTSNLSWTNKTPFRAAKFHTERRSGRMGEKGRKSINGIEHGLTKKKIKF